MGENEKPEPKISTPEAILAFLILAVVEGIEGLLVFFGLDDFWISDIIAFPITQIYLRIKGVKSEASLVANLLELIPYAGWLPLRTIGFSIVVYLDRHPKLEGAVKKAAGRAAVVKAKGGAQLAKGQGTRKARVVAERRRAAIEGFRGGSGQLPESGSGKEGLGESFDGIKRSMENLPEIPEYEASFASSKKEKPPVPIKDIRPAVDNNTRKELL